MSTGEPRSVVLAKAGTDGVEWPCFTTTTPGLVVHESMGDPGWVVTHERSGLCLAMVDSEPAAYVMAAALAAAGDWTRSGVDIRADSEMTTFAGDIKRRLGDIQSYNWNADYPEEAARRHAL